MTAVQQYESYKRIKLLGQGSYGKAYLVQQISDSSQCVLKEMDLKAMSKEERSATLKESKILEALIHPNIIKFREVYTTKKGKLCIIMDYADGGDLQKKIEQAKGNYIPESQVLDWLTQICLGIKHIHDRKIIHRDLKSSNIFLTRKGIIKIGDFGIARVLQRTLDNAKTVIGTPYYLSPEIIQNRAYNQKSDIWSLGVILYEICALRPPFDASSLQYLCSKIVKGQYADVPVNYSKEMKELIRMMLQTEPGRRPDINQILRLPIITNRIKNFLSVSVQEKEFSHTILHNKLIANEGPIPEDILKKQKIQEQQLLLQRLQQQNINPPVKQQPSSESNKYVPPPLPQKVNSHSRQSSEKKISRVKFGVPKVPPYGNGIPTHHNKYSKAPTPRANYQQSPSPMHQKKPGKGQMFPDIRLGSNYKVQPVPSPFNKMKQDIEREDDDEEELENMKGKGNEVKGQMGFTIGLERIKNELNRYLGSGLFNALYVYMKSEYVKNNGNIDVLEKKYLDEKNYQKILPGYDKQKVQYIMGLMFSYLEMEKMKKF